jgi:hypothetical protein
MTFRRDRLANARISFRPEHWRIEVELCAASRLRAHLVSETQARLFGRRAKGKRSALESTAAADRVEAAVHAESRNVPTADERQNDIAQKRGA